MKRRLSGLFEDFEKGKLNRRQLLEALGMAAGGVAIVGAAACSPAPPAPAAEQAAPAPDPTAKPVPTGKPRMAWNKTYERSGPFKTISVGHISYSVPNQRAARDWYIDVLGMTAVFDTGKNTALRFGVPWNHIYLGQAGDANAKAAIGHMSYNIEKFRLEAVEAELKARNLPNSYDGPEMIHTDDPDAYRVQPASLVAIYPGGGSAENVENLTQEDGLKAALRTAPRPTYQKLVATAMNHISHTCIDYAKVRDYYMDLWGMRKVSDDGKVAVVEFGGTYGDPPQQVWLRSGVQAGAKQYVDHIGYSVENFDLAKVGALLRKLNLNPKAAGPNAWAINDIAGFPVMICAEKGGVNPADAYGAYGL